MKYKSGPPKSFKGPLAFYKNIKDDYTTLEKTKENQKKNKLNQI